MENKIGRLLEKGEVVHHRDEDKANDDPDNLELTTHEKHGKHHHAGKVQKIRCVCPCGDEFFLLPSKHRLRMRENTCGVLYCKRSCWKSHVEK